MGKKFLKSSSFLTLGFFVSLLAIGCKENKKDNTGILAVGLLALSQKASSATTGGGSSSGGASDPTSAANTNADGSTTFTAPSRLSVMGGSTSSVTTSNVLDGSFGNVRDLASVAKALKVAIRATAAETDGVAALADYAKDTPDIFFQDPISMELSQIDQFFQMLDLSGYKYLVDKGPRKVKFSNPEKASGGSKPTGGASSQANKLTWTVQASSKEKDATGASIPLRVKIWGYMDFGNNMKPKLDILFDVVEAPTKTTVEVDGVKTETQKGGKYSLSLQLSMSQTIDMPSSTGGTTSIKMDMVGAYIIKKSAEGTKDILKIWNNFTMKMNGTEAMGETAWTNIESNNGGETGKVTFSKSSMSSMSMGGGSTSGGSTTAMKIRMGETGGTGGSTTASGPVTTTFNGTSAWNADFIYAQVPDPTSTTGTAKTITLDRKNPEKIVYSYGLYDSNGKRVNLKTGFPIKTSDGKEGWAGRWGVSLFDQATGAMSSGTDGQKVTEVKFDGTEGSAFTISVAPGRMNVQIRQQIPLTEIQGIPLNYWSFDMATNTSAKLVVKYDGANWVKEKSCSVDSTTYKETCTTASGNLTIEANKQYFFQLAGEQSGGKSISWKLGDANATAEIFDEVDSIPGGATSLTLYEYDVNACYMAKMNSQAYTPTTYTFDSTMTLKDSTGTAVAASTTTPSVFKFGLVDTQLTIATAEDCFKIYDPTAVARSYSWNSGTDEWSKKTVLKNADGSMFKFDRPIPFTVKTDKGMFTASYYGFGQFDIPWVQDPNADPNDFMSWKPVAVIANGLKLVTKIFDPATNATTDKNFYVKHLVAALKYRITTNDAGALKAEVATALPEVTVTAAEKDIATINGADPTTGQTAVICVVDGFPVDASGNQVATFAESLCATK